MSTEAGAGGATPAGPGATIAAGTATGTAHDDAARGGTVVTGAPGATAVTEPPDAPGAAGAGGAAPAAAPGRGRRTATVTALVVAGLLAVLAVPLVVALGVLHQPRWYPLLDLAQTELRVRDVGTRHTPLVGLAGRIQAYGQQGSHPGPISFWALAPVYRLFGASSWALQVACVSLHLAAMAAILWVAHRRGGRRAALAFAAVLAVLTHAYGPGTLTEAWNPYMPVLWWLLFLLAVWSVLCDDLAMLPVAVLAGTFCMQTHVSYLGLVGGVAGLVVAAAVVWATRHRRDRAALGGLLRWTGAAAVLGVVLWIPPMIDQVRRDPGNASMIVESFRHPSDDPVGLRTGSELLGIHLNLWRLLTATTGTTGSVLPGLVLLAVWAASAVVAWRLRHAALIRLHALLAAVLVLGLVSLSRIFGEVWYYLALWAWGITALMVVAIVWTAAAALAARRTPPAADVVAAPGGPALGTPAAAGPVGAAGTAGAGPVDLPPAAGAGRARVRALAAPGALAAVLVVWTALFTVDASHAEVPAHRQSDLLRALAPPTIAALDDGVGGAGGRDGRYLVTWTDPVAIGASGFGLLLELERQGFHVGVPEFHAVGAVPHRVLRADQATAEVHLSIGSDIDTWRSHPGAVTVAEVDLRTPAEHRRYAELRAAAIDRLQEAGLPDVVPTVDGALMAIAIDERVPDDVQAMVDEMANLGQPAAVFVAPT